MRRIRINVNNDDPWKIKIIEGSTSSSRVYSGEKKRRDDSPKEHCIHTPIPDHSK